MPSVQLTRLQALYANSQRNRKVALASYLYGWPIDQQRQQRCAMEIDNNITEADEEISACLSELRDSLPPEEAKAHETFFLDFNANSAEQVGRLFYGILEEPVRVRTDQGRPSSGSAALEAIARSGQPISQRLAKALKKRKANAKLREAYINNLSGIELVRPSAHVTAQVGGRWSYRDPALQTVPAFIKPMFVAHPGGWMVACDLAGAEYRSMALQAGCLPMLNAYNKDGDLHWETAETLFGCSREKLDKNIHRKLAKGVGLGFHYSVLDIENAAAGLYAQVGHKVKGLTFEMMLGALKRLAKARPEIMEFKRRTLERALRDDYVEEPINHRRRYFYGKVKDTEAYNFAQQAMIAAIVDRAVQGVHTDFRPGEGLHLQRHDEIIIGGPDPVRLCELHWKHMRQAYEIGGNSLCFEIEMEVTRRWGESVAIAPQKLGTEFHVECRCGHGSKHGKLSDAAKDAAKHYDHCERMEGAPKR